MPIVPSAHHAHTRGVRAVALLEILKGTLAFAGIIGLLVLMHRRDIGNFAEDIIFKLHLDPTSKLPWMFIEKAYDLGGRSLWTIIAIALAYVIIRFIEGYGLWHERIWAEWFA
ncbi:MAG TPA: DUF2127 domain-containing protein, partial [Terriglobales bacterium]